MKGGYLALVGLGVLSVGSFLWSNGVCKSFTEKQNAAKAVWSQVQSAYQRRLDLVPSLMETLKASTKIDKAVLSDVIEARALAESLALDPSILDDPDKFKKYDASQVNLGRLLTHS